jgi:hypothetical protein
VFVIREGHEEGSGIEEPSEDHLEFSGGAFGNELGF